MKLNKKPMAPDEILKFLEGFQEMIASVDGPRKLISMRVPENLLAVFKAKAKSNNIPYQRQIIELMRQWCQK